MKLEEREALLVAIDQDDCYNAIVNLIEELCSIREREVIKFTFDPSKLNELAAVKARADGARILATDLYKALSSLKKRPLKGVS